jgi:hypothetical protein
MSDNTLDDVLNRVAGAEQIDPRTVASVLSSVAKREDGRQVLRGPLQNNTDPLEVLDPAAQTLPFLYILFVLAYGYGFDRELMKRRQFHSHGADPQDYPEILPFIFKTPRY